MWILFPAGLFARQLPVKGQAVAQRDADQITLMFGTRQWEEIYRLRLRNDISPREAREEYVNLMRWRLEHVLGYKVTHPFEILNERGGPLYHMIFATDNEAGDRIMRDIYQRAMNEHPAMRDEAKAMRDRMALEALGQHDLFSASGIEAPTGSSAGAVLTYSHERPWTPPGLIEP